MHKLSFPWGKVALPKPSDNRTPVVYYGGKSRDADWIIGNMPPHDTFVDVFGGGGAITFRKPLSNTVVYNDIGNVSNFFRVLREHGEELTRRLYLTPFSREEFLHCASTWMDVMNSGDEIEWARRWYVTVSQGYTHEENGRTWRVSKQVSTAEVYSRHVDELPYIIEKLKSIQIEHCSFEKLIPLYDIPEALLYCDPPYLSETRASLGNYMNEMSEEKHREFLEMVTRCKAQVIVSGYDSDLYHSYLGKWRIARKTALSAIQNSSSIKNRASRTEVLWIKEHRHGLWSEVS